MSSSMPELVKVEKSYVAVVEFAEFADDDDDAEAVVDSDNMVAGVGGEDGGYPYSERPDDCWWDESVASEDEEVESHDNLPEHLPIPTNPPPIEQRPHASTKNRDVRPPLPGVDRLRAKSKVSVMTSNGLDGSAMCRTGGDTRQCFSS
ncbi:unnamed protein product [Closterium sp. NIES-53]